MQVSGKPCIAFAFLFGVNVGFLSAYMFFLVSDTSDNSSLVHMEHVENKINKESNNIYQNNEPFAAKSNMLSLPKDTIIMSSDLRDDSYWNEAMMKRGSGMKQQLICTNMDTLANNISNTESRALLNYTIDCRKYYDNSGLGTGNWISAFYGLRIAALTHGGIDIYMGCDDAMEERTNLILPWLMGYWPARDKDSSYFSPHPDATKKPLELTSLEIACGNYYKSPVGHMTPFIQYEMRRMAIAIVGVPDDESHPSWDYLHKTMWNEEQVSSLDLYDIPTPKPGDAPLVPGIEIDDAAIHFRCGDIMGASQHGSFGFLKFTVYKKYISSSVRSIGIITQPFDYEGQLRKGADSRAAVLNRCKVVTLELKQYLEENFKDATVNIWNDINETLPTAYSRLIMAKQTFVSISSFGAFAALSSFGTGYMRKPNFRDPPNLWSEAVAEFYDDDTLVLVDEPILFAPTVSSTLHGKRGSSETPPGMDKIIHWFKTEDYDMKDAWPVV